MAHTGQQQVHQHRNVKPALEPSFLPAHWVLPQPQVGIQFSVDLLHRPPALIRAHHLSQSPLVQIGQQDLRLLGANVSSGFAQDHSDVAEMTQTQARAIHPEGLGTRTLWEAGNPCPLVRGAGQVRHHVFDRLALGRFPPPCNGKDNADADLLATPFTIPELTEAMVRILTDKTLR